MLVWSGTRKENDGDGVWGEGGKEGVDECFKGWDEMGLEIDEIEARESKMIMKVWN